MKTKYRYKDINNVEIYPKFRLGGFQNSVLTCTLYKKRNIPSWIPFNNSLIFYKEVAFGVSTDSIQSIDKWQPQDYNNLVLHILKKYNAEVGVKERINNKIKDMNNL